MDNEIYAFSSALTIKSIIANVHKQNTASIKFIERLGFLLRDSCNEHNDSNNDETNSFICYEKRVT